MRYLLAFNYRDQSDDSVKVDFNGCGLVTNDVLKPRYYPNEALRRVLSDGVASRPGAPSV